MHMDGWSIRSSKLDLNYAKQGRAHDENLPQEASTKEFDKKEDTLVRFPGYTVYIFVGVAGALSFLVK
jgi:hypothetical protein